MTISPAISSGTATWIAGCENAATIVTMTTISGSALSTGVACCVTTAAA